MRARQSNKAQGFLYFKFVPLDCQRSSSQSFQQTRCFRISLFLFLKTSELILYQVLLLSLLGGRGSGAASQHSGGFEGNVTL